MDAGKVNAELSLVENKAGFKSKNLFQQQKSKESKDMSKAESDENLKPMVISKEEYRYIFGDSSDEEHEFYGFEEDELGLKEFRSVVSPNKLKLQDDFYLPLFLSHRKRKRCISYEKVGSEEGTAKKNVLGKESRNEANIFEPKTGLQISPKSPNLPAKEECFPEISNPYAKQYRSYRKSRSRSLLTCFSQNEESMENVESAKEEGEHILTTNSSRDWSSSKDALTKKKCSDVSPSKEFTKFASSPKKENDLKLKIQYHVNTRPKRTVSVPEKKDFVYDISFPSNKKPRHLSPPMITNAKIVHEDFDAFGAPDIYTDAANTPEVQIVSKLKPEEQSYTLDRSTISSDGRDERIVVNLKKDSSDILKSTRKKRFKNIKSSNIGFPRALLTDILLSDSGSVISYSAPSGTGGPLTTERNTDLNEIQSEKCSMPIGDLDFYRSDQSKHPTRRDNNCEDRSQETVSSVCIGEDKKKEDQYKSIDSKMCKEPCLDSSAYINEKVDINVAKSVFRPADKKEPPEQEEVMPKSKLNCAQNEASKTQQTNERTEVSRQLSKKSKRLSNRRSARDHCQSNLVSKAKSISLTDTWFSAANIPTKKKNRPSKSRYSTTNEAFQKDFSKTKNRKSEDTLTPVFNETEHPIKIKASSLAKRRRLKNVTLSENVNECSCNNAAHECLMGVKMPVEEHFPNQCCECGKSLSFESTSVKRNTTSLLEIDSEKLLFCIDCERHRQNGKWKFEINEHTSLNITDKALNEKTILADIASHSEDNLNITRGSLYTDCPLSVAINIADLEAIQNFQEALRNEFCSNTGNIKDSQPTTSTEIIANTFQNRSANFGMHKLDKGKIVKQDKDGSYCAHTFNTFDYAQSINLAENSNFCLDQQNRFSRRKIPRATDGKNAANEVTFSKPLDMIIPDVVERNLDFTNITTPSDITALLDGDRKKEKGTPVDRNSADFKNEKKEKKTSRYMTKSDSKNSKNSRSGRSFIIKTAVDNLEKQTAMTKDKCYESKAVTPSRNTSNTDLYDPRPKSDMKDTCFSSTDDEETIEGRTRNRNISPERFDRVTPFDGANKGKKANSSISEVVPNLQLQDNANNDQLFDGKKVKRKIYTVVRKIRRTEVNAEGKKVTKIIKQIIKKVCPVVDEGYSEVSKRPGGSAKQNSITKVMTAHCEKSRTSGDTMNKKAVEKLKTNSSNRSRCGECIGCLQRDDCSVCNNCRKKEENLADKNEVRNCLKKQCVAIRNAENRILSKDTKEASKALKQRDGKFQHLKPPSKDESDSKKDETSRKAIPASQTHDKPKAKSKSIKTALKEADRTDIVYSPGFKLRSKVNETIKVAPGRVLKQVQYSGLEPTVKLPWPEEQGESAVYDSGHFCCLTSPIAIKAKDTCYHCGSGGYLKMIYCIDCSEAYHDFCIDIDPLDESNWLCDRCKRCNVCGFKDNLLMCDNCHGCYHVECLGPNYHKKTEGDDDLWVCAKCVQCTKCGKKTPGKRKESKWMNNFSMCEECERRFRRGQYCIVCENVYSENDYETKMMYCTTCKKWIHMECEGLSVDEYECLAELPDNVPYICKTCHNKETWPMWYQEVREEINAGFEKLYYDFLESCDYKIIKKNVREAEFNMVNQKLEKIFSNVQQNKFSKVVDFLKAFEDYLDDLGVAISDILPGLIIKDMRRSLNEQAQSMFPWTEKNEEDKSSSQALKSEQKTGILVPTYAVPAIKLDHAYNANKKESKAKANEEKTNAKNFADRCQHDVENKDSYLVDASSQASMGENIFDKLMCFEPALDYSEVIDDKSLCNKIDRQVALNAASIKNQTDRSVAGAEYCNNLQAQVDAAKRESEAPALVAVQSKDGQVIDKLKTDSRKNECLPSVQSDVGESDSVVDSKDDDAMEDDISQDEDSAGAEVNIRAAKHNDDRRCLLCNQYGDEPQNEAGRILSAGLDEWVHVNCALWSAEVYENDSGLLQNVHTALARGQKLRCSVCQQWGATVGCCATNCPSNFHFMCARDKNIVFQDNKIVYCERHKNKSKNQVLLSDDGFAVLRPVMVGMSKVLSLKKFSVARDPHSIHVYSGSLTVNRLGRLSESSDGAMPLIPIGFRATRVFWDAKDCRRRCKYYFSIEEKQNISKGSSDKKEINEVITGGSTICHDAKSPKRNQRRKMSNSDSPSQRKRMRFESGESNLSILSGDQLKSTQASLNAFLSTKKELVAENTISGNIEKRKCQLLQGRPLKKGKDPFILSRVAGLNELAVAKSSPLQSQCLQTADPPHTDKNDINSTSLVPSKNKQSLNNLFHSTLRNSNHEFIGHAESNLTTPCCRFPLQSVASSCNEIEKQCNTVLHNTSDYINQSGLPESATSKPRLIQPNLRYQVCSSVLSSLSIDNSSSSCKPILSKFEGYSTKLADNLQSYLTKNPQMFNFVGNANVPELTQGVALSSQSVESSIGKFQNTLSPIPCYSLNVSEEFLKTLGPQLTQKESKATDKSPNEHTSLPQVKPENENTKRDATVEAVEQNTKSVNVLEDFKQTTAVAATSITEKPETQPCSVIPVNELSSIENPTDLILPDISKLVNELPQCPSSLIDENERVLAAANQQERNSDVDSSFSFIGGGRGLGNSKSAKIKLMNAVPKENSKAPIASKDLKRNKKWYIKRLQKLQTSKIDQKRESSLLVVVKNEEGLRLEGDSIEGVWKDFIDIVNETRIDQKLPPLLFSEQDAFDFFGLSKFPIVFLTEQLPGGQKCRNYQFQYHLPCLVDEDKELPLNAHGCARAELYARHSRCDMFSWLASPYRTLPRSQDEPENESEIKSSSDLPLSMRFRQLKSNVKDHVGVYRSAIDGRGLFCKRKIETGEMVIEYAGSVIRGTLTDKRENYYDGKGYGCYMFRIDDTNVVDATLFGNEARFINHSCEPNCYSRIVPVDGKKHIVIFASRSIFPGEELTYDYKFPFEEEKLPCHCGSKKCRKYLN